MLRRSTTKPLTLSATIFQLSTSYGTTLPPLVAVRRRRGRSCDRGRSQGEILCECKRIGREQLVGGRGVLETCSIDGTRLAKAAYRPDDLE